MAGQLRADGASLAYERYDLLPKVDTGAIVENKRLSHALQTALVIQAQRDDRHASNTPSRTNSGQPPYAKKLCLAANALVSSRLLILSLRSA
jgi:hypothetical protein